MCTVPPNVFAPLRTIDSLLLQTVEMKNALRDSAPPRGLFGPPCPLLKYPLGPLWLSLVQTNDRREGGGV